MKRKVVATLLSACMAASLMAGCGQSSGSTAASGGASAQTGTAGTSESASGDPLDADGDGAVDNPEDVVVDENKLVLWSLFAGGDGEYFDSLIEDYNSKDPPKQVQSILAATMARRLLHQAADRRGGQIRAGHRHLPRVQAAGVRGPGRGGAAERLPG